MVSKSDTIGHKGCLRRLIQLSTDDFLQVITTVLELVGDVLVSQVMFPRDLLLLSRRKHQVSLRCFLVIVPALDTREDPLLQTADGTAQ